MAIFGDRGGLALGGLDILFATMGSMFQKNVKVVFDTLEWIYLGTLYVPGDWFGFGTQKRESHRWRIRQFEAARKADGGDEEGIAEWWSASGYRFRVRWWYGPWTPFQVLNVL